MLRWFEHRQVFVPKRDFVAGPEDLGHPFEEVYFQAQDRVRLHGWYFPALDPSRDGGGEVILLLHGNAGNISTRLDYYDAFLETGAAVFTFDYRGYGRSEGDPSESGSYLDAEAAVRWLEGRGMAARRIIAYGESLGGGVASELMTRRPLAGLVLHNSFTSVPDLGKELYPWLPVQRFASIHYHTRLKLPRIRVPVLVMHSREDRLIGFHHAERNFAAANDPKILWELRGGHVEALDAGRDRLVEGLRRFLALIRNFAI